MTLTSFFLITVTVNSIVVAAEDVIEESSSNDKCANNNTAPDKNVKEFVDNLPNITCKTVYGRVLIQFRPNDKCCQILGYENITNILRNSCKRERYYKFYKLICGSPKVTPGNKKILAYTATLSEYCQNYIGHLMSTEPNILHCKNWKKNTRGSGLHIQLECSFRAYDDLTNMICGSTTVVMNTLTFLVCLFVHITRQ